MRGVFRWFTRSERLVVCLALALAVLLPQSFTTLAQVAPAPPPPLTAQAVPVIGEIERLTLNNPADVWSGGTMVVGGQSITLPRNLLIDYPANRLTLQQTFAQAPAACQAAGESGLAKLEKCNTLGRGGLATIAANRTSGGSIIAGDVFLQKGLETIQGTVTYINYAEGYFRLDGNPNDATTGVMVRLNDPTARHTLQLGAGCAGGPNCSPDPRFTGDPDNYTQVFETGYPVCIPSTAPRTFTDALNLGGTPNAQLTAQANPDGSGDLLCPTTNRPAPTTAALLALGSVVLADDARRLAPIQLGDSVIEQGNFETINGVRFLSAWSTHVGVKLETRAAPGQPDYVIIDKMFIDAPAFQRQRSRALFQGKTTLEASDVLIWSTHHDPATNATHELPLASTSGCDTAVGKGQCTFIGGVPDQWRIKYDIDYRPSVAVDPKLYPCPQLRADRRLGSGICPLNGLEDNFSVMSPMTHEIHARTGNKLANPGLVTIDVLGNTAPNGQYLFPMGIGLGGIEILDFAEINPGLIATPTFFSGIPWNLDRRLSPNGCIGACESTPQPLDPFPFEGLDPRTQAANVIFPGAGVPSGTYSDPTFTASPLTNDSNRILSFVDPAIGKFNGDRTILAWPPANPAAQPIMPIMPMAGSVTAPGTPTGAAATVASPTQAAVSWTAPAANGGSAITSYTVTALVNGVPPKPPITVSVAAPATTTSVGGLTTGTTYTFIVSATNAVGSGGNSAPSNPVTPAAPAAPPATLAAPAAPATLAAPGAPLQSLAAASALSVAAPIQNSTLPVTLSWSPGSSSGITGYQLQQSSNGGAFADVLPQPGTVTSAALKLPTGLLTAPQTYQFQVRACSSPTTCSSWSIGQTFSLTPVDDTVAANVGFRGSWPVATVAGAYGGTVRAASAAGSNATFSGLTWTHTGSVGWVSTLGPDRGIASVSIDGGAPVTIDLFAPTLQPAQIVFALNGLSPGSHTVVVTAQGSKNPASTGNRVDVDAFVAIL